MKFKLTENAVTITAESVADAMRLAEHYTLLNPSLGDVPKDPAELPAYETKVAAALAQLSANLAGVTAGNLTHVDAGTEKRPWFEQHAELGPAAVKPYLDLLERITGYTGEVPRLDLLYKGRGLSFTHLVSKCEFSSAGISVKGFIRSEDWNGMPAASRAVKYFYDYVVEEFGFRKSEPQYLRAGNHTMVENPNYLKNHPAEHGLGSPLLWQVLFTWWRTHLANDAQRAVLDQVDATAKGFQLDAGWRLRETGAPTCALVDYGGLHTTYKGDAHDFVSWEQFKSL